MYALTSEGMAEAADIEKKATAKAEKAANVKKDVGA
jgi:hypothetical protein